MTDKDDYLWVEKYRPHTIEDCVLPDNLKAIFQKYVDQKQVPNMILSGHAGVGKTTVAKAMLDQLGCDYMVINGSLNAGIDVLRTNIQEFATSVSFKGGKKYVILDEADGLSHVVQPALRNFIEEYSNNCGFILTCNYKNKLIDALHSRCPVIEFSVTEKDRMKLSGKFLKRAMGILKENDIVFEPSVVAEVVNKHYPDWREVLGKLQQYSASGKIDSGIFNSANSAEFDKLAPLMQQKKYTEIRAWVAENSNLDSSEFFDKIFALCERTMSIVGQAQSIMIIAKYQYQASFVASQEINNIAMLVELMIQDGVWN